VGSRAVAGTQRVARDGGAKLPRGQGVCGTPAEGGFTVLNDVVLNQVLVSFGSPEETRRVIPEIQGPNPRRSSPSTKR
jgi:hypothetical protein